MCSKGLSLFFKGKVDYQQYIANVPPVPMKVGKKVFCKKTGHFNKIEPHLMLSDFLKLDVGDYLYYLHAEFCLSFNL